MELEELDKTAAEPPEDLYPDPLTLLDGSDAEDSVGDDGVLSQALFGVACFN